jgi:hypothetical protein
MENEIFDGLVVDGQILPIVARNGNVVVVDTGDEYLDVELEAV